MMFCSSVHGQRGTILRKKRLDVKCVLFLFRKKFRKSYILRNNITNGLKGKTGEVLA